MIRSENILIDKYNRLHNYLRISITERCNLRCSYCMPGEGIDLSSHSSMMTYEEIFEIARVFVESGVDKIRITGGEPTVRKDFIKVLRMLSELKVDIGITTNGVLLDRYIDDLADLNIRKINISLDSLDEKKNKLITRRDHFNKVLSNIVLLERSGFFVKVNCVLINGVNDDEIIRFVELTKNMNISVRFIEYMPFDGNKWELSKMVPLEEILHRLSENYTPDKVVRLESNNNDTSKNYRIKGYKGNFGIISTVSKPFCDSCNRIRLTANGHLKNCLFSTEEQDLLTSLRQGKDISAIVNTVVKSKHQVRGGMETNESFALNTSHIKNRSMVKIGG